MNAPLDLLWPIVIVVFGAGVAIWGVILRGRGEETLQWPTVRGKVYASRVVEERSRDADNETMYRPEIRYEYVVDGKEFAAKRLGLEDTPASWRSYADGIVARFPIGREVEIFYNPDDPSEALLEPRDAVKWGAMAVVGGIVIGAGGFVWAILLNSA